MGVTAVFLADPDDLDTYIFFGKGILRVGRTYSTTSGNVEKTEFFLTRLESGTVNNGVSTTVSGYWSTTPVFGLGFTSMRTFETSQWLVDQAVDVEVESITDNLDGTFSVKPKATLILDGDSVPISGGDRDEYTRGNANSPVTVDLYSDAHYIQNVTKVSVNVYVGSAFPDRNSKYYWDRLAKIRIGYASHGSSAYTWSSWLDSKILVNEGHHFIVSANVPEGNYDIKVHVQFANAGARTYMGFYAMHKQELLMLNGGTATLGTETTLYSGGVDYIAIGR